MKVDEVRILVEAGVLGKPVVGLMHLPRYYITFQRLSGQGVGVDLQTSRGELRLFATLDAVASLLFGLDIHSFTVGHVS